MFKNRIDAGEQLAKKLKDYSKKENTVVLGIPRGGVVVASIVSKILEIPLDIMVIKKIGLPGNEEFAIGAAGPKMFHVDENKVKEFRVKKDIINQKVESKKREAKERRDFLTEGRAPQSLKDKVVILVDDGVATGETMSLAVQVVKSESPEKIIVAIPVIAEDSVDKLNADEIIYVTKSVSLGSIGEFYSDFPQTEDSEVKELLKNGY